MRVSSVPLVVVLGLVVASCGSTDPTTVVAEDSLPSRSATSGRPFETTEDEPRALCGTELPVFASELDRSDRRNVDGSVGPGPDSLPAVGGQLVTHWVGEYATYELRWPPAEPAVEVEAWPVSVAELPASAPEVGENRLRLTVQLDESGHRCSRLSVEVYGPRSDPLFDEIHMFAGRLRPRSQLASYPGTVSSESNRADSGADRLPGECAEPIVVAEVDSYGRLSEEIAVELAGRFMRDRIAGRRASDCLTIAALNRYSESSTPELCLFGCGSGATLTGPEPLVLESVGFSDGTLILSLVQLDGPPVTYREQLEVRAFERPDGSLEALISNVVAFPESFVDADRAEELVDKFLTDLANGDYASGAGLLVNEGYTQEVADALGDVYSGDAEVAELLRDYCRRALCAVGYTIVGSDTPSLFRAEVTVRIDSPAG
ncbi:MAG: hypothetical protein O3C27_15975, partial [Actinomycetota bacterium]|nr:hypothetical protein [Actinomycetota bacterium]